MEVRTKWIIGILANIIPAGLTLLITKAIVKPSASWWWFLGVLAVQIMADIIFGAVIFYKFQ